MNYKIRTILEGEDGLLQDFLYEAIFVPEGLSAPPKTIINQPELQRYISDFGKRKDDIGLVAEVNKKVVWARIMNDYGQYHSKLQRATIITGEISYAREQIIQNSLSFIKQRSCDRTGTGEEAGGFCSHYLS